MNNYHETHNWFPPFIISRTGNPQRIADADKGANWLVFLLPYVDQNAIYDKWDLDIPANQNPGRSTKIAGFMCPTDPANSGPPCSYAGGGWARGNYGMNVSPCAHNSLNGNTGVPSALGGIGGPNYVVRFGHVADGAANTIAVDELRTGLNQNDLRGSWAMPGLGSGTSALFQ